ncbi:TlpA family protein disulfide reductase [Halorientalis salina]|uniref:TlpA family protein disulfide reductase n=1 Tax=Halorientalis salina TaxID=2932266 RepID=UPI0010AB86A3|nr:TlpA disulfide reductase family protein [Halorientalis salina]
MRRRELIAAALSTGAVGAGGWYALSGGPSVGENPSDTGSDGNTSALGSSENANADGSRIDPVELDVVDPGGETRTARVPDADRVTFIDFFATWCAPCEEQMPVLADVYASLEADVQFLSVTPEPVGRTITKAELLEWWDENDGTWDIALDRRAALNERFGVTAYPAAVVLDEAGRYQWTHRGLAEAETLREGIESVL